MTTRYSLRTTPVRQVAINRNTGGHSEILDVLLAMGHVYGSATNAAIQAIVTSPLYRQWAHRVQREREEHDQAVHTG